MYNYFMIIGTLEEDFIKIEDKKSTIKVKCYHPVFNYQVLPVNISGVAQYMDDFMYKGDRVAIKGRIEFNYEGNLELVAERLMIFQRVNHVKKETN